MSERIFKTFMEGLDLCNGKAKFKEKFDSEDKKMALEAFQLVFENPSLSDELVYDLLSGGKQ